jgi:hypothetical protein
VQGSEDAAGNRQAVRLACKITGRHLDRRCPARGARYGRRHGYEILLNGANSRRLLREGPAAYRKAKSQAAPKVTGSIAGILDVTLPYLRRLRKAFGAVSAPGEGTQRENAALCIVSLRTRFRRPVPAQYLMEMRDGMCNHS